MSRWSFPLVPDNNHPGGHVYDHLRGNRYIPKDNTVVLSRTCKIGNNTLLGAHTQVFENAQVSASVVGQHCTIGAGAVISQSYIFDGTVIGAGVHVEKSIVGANVRIGDKSAVQRGCLVGDGVVLGRNASLRPFEKVSVKLEGEDNDSDEDSDAEEADSVDGEAATSTSRSTLMSAVHRAKAYSW